MEHTVEWAANEIREMRPSAILTLGLNDLIQKVVDEAVNEEREACAKIAASTSVWTEGNMIYANKEFPEALRLKIVKRIRERGTQATCPICKETFKKGDTHCCPKELNK